MLGKIFGIALAILVVSALALVPGAAPVKVALAQSHIGVNVTPQQTTVGFNENFNVTIWIDDSLGESYDGVAIRLVYNTSYVTATGVTDAGTFDFVLDNGTIDNTWNATHGLVKYDAVNLAGPLNTSNPVCTVNFTSSSSTGIAGLDFIYVASDAATSVTSVGADILNWTYVVNGTVKVGMPALTVNVTPAGKGGVKVAGVTPSSYPNTTSWNWGEVVTLEAVDSVGGGGFDHWSGDLSGSTNPTNITMYDSYSIMANFARTQEVSFEIQPDMTEEDTVMVIALSRQMTALDKDGNELESITISKEVNPLQPPEGCYFVGMVYNMAPDGAVFAPPLALSMAYDETDLPQGMVEKELYLAYCDDKGQWVDLTSEVDSDANRVTAEVNHFTLFAIMARPASFTLSEFSVMPHIVQVGETVTAGIMVTNVGGCEDRYTLVLKVNGVIEDSKEVTLAIGESQEVSFEAIRESAGDYSVDINGHTASFVVKGTNWGRIGGVIGGIVVVGLLIYFFVFRKRRARLTAE